MTINAPTPRQIPQLKTLWQQAFGDTAAFIDNFFATGFAPDRCRCLTLDGDVAAALYWFDAEKDGEKFAYLYAVATEENHRGKGLCRRLMEDTHRHLAKNGYAGAVLVPAEEGLWGYYGKMGYLPFGNLRLFTAEAKNAACVQEISSEKYTLLRSFCLPAEAFRESQIGFYGTWGKFYQGKDCLFAAAIDEECLFVQEFLGNDEIAHSVVAALGCSRGHFRVPGGSDPCGMYLLFKDVTPPAYLGFPLD